MSEITMKDVEDEIDRIHEQGGEAAFVRFMQFFEVVGKEANNKTMAIIGLMNAAAIACKLGDYKLCVEIVADANEIDDEICTNYLQEQPRMHEMMETLSEAGALNQEL